MIRLNLCVSVDVENPQTPLMEKRFAENRLADPRTGVPALVALLRAAGVRATCFVNVCEQAVWGPEPLRAACRALADAGHEVGLHTHPFWMDPQRRENMHQLPEREQEGLIRWGAGFLRDALGDGAPAPASHRAGAYGANAATLRACARAGFLADSSTFHGHPFCRAVPTADDPVRAHGVLELPVSCVLRDGQRVKVDPDALDDARIEAAVDAAAARAAASGTVFGSVSGTAPRDYLGLMFHSYSLGRTDDGYRTLRPAPDKVERLVRLLGRLAARPDVRVVTLREYATARAEGRAATPQTGPGRAA